MKKTIAVFGTMDTKGEEYQFLRQQLESFGLKVLMIDTGIHSDHGYSCDIDARQVAEAGGAALEEIQEHDRTFAFEIMGKDPPRSSAGFAAPARSTEQFPWAEAREPCWRQW